MTKPVNHSLRAWVLLVLCTLPLLTTAACRRRSSTQNAVQTPTDAPTRAALDARVAQLLVSISSWVDPHSTAPRPTPLNVTSATAIVSALRNASVPLQLALLHPYPHLNQLSPDASPLPATVRSGHTILLTHTVAPNERDPLIDGLLVAQRDPTPNEPVASCFNPRHAILFSLNGVEYQWIICLECSQAQLWMGDRLIVGSTVTAQPFVAGIPAAVRARQTAD